MSCISVPLNDHCLRTYTREFYLLGTHDIHFRHSSFIVHVSTAKYVYVTSHCHHNPPLFESMLFAPSFRLPVPLHYHHLLKKHHFKTTRPHHLYSLAITIWNTWLWICSNWPQNFLANPPIAACSPTTWLGTPNFAPPNGPVRTAN